MTLAMDLNLDLLKTEFETTIRRLAFFAGLTHRARDDESVRDYYIEAAPGGMTFGLLPGGLSAETIREGRTQLAQWTAEMALRDLVESFEQLMTPPFHAAIALMVKDGTLSTTKAKEISRGFNFGGLKEKCDRYREHIGLTISVERHFGTLNKFRNTQTHRRSIVSTHDVDEATGTMETTWTALELQLIGESGVTFTGADALDVALNEPASIALRIVERKVEHVPGQRLQLDIHQLHEIMVMMHMEAQNFIILVAKRLVEIGAMLRTS